jgi:histone H3/H4
MTSTTRERTTESHGIRTYLGRILRAEAPGTNISRQAMDCTNALMTQTVERLVRGALVISQRVGNVTISEEDLRAAAELVLPENLREGAIQAGDNAIRNYERQLETSGITSPASTRGGRGSRGGRTTRASTSVSSPVSASTSQGMRRQYDGAAALSSSATSTRRRPVRRASRAELIMAPPRIEELIRSTMQRYPRSVQRGENVVAINRLSDNASIFLAGVIEYLARELFRTGSVCTAEAGRRLMRDVELMSGFQRSQPLTELAGPSFISRYSQTDGNTEQESLDTSQA